jgi:hypothetical protein
VGLSRNLYPPANGVILARVEPYTVTFVASIYLDTFNPLGDEVGPTSGTDEYFAETTSLLSGNATRCRQQSRIHSW